MLEKGEKKELTKILKFGGYKTYKSNFFNSKDYKNLRAVFLDNLPKADITFPNIHFCSLDTVKKAGIEIVQNHTRGIDLKVPYTVPDDLKSKLIEKFGTTPSTEKIEEIIIFIKNNINFKKVTDIPIFLNLSDARNGFATFQTFYPHFTNLKYYEKIPIVTQGIKITGPCDDFSKGIYVHEMYHILSKRNKGYTQNYLFDEFLSIFMEQITALDINENLIESAFLKRLISIKDDIINLTHNEFYNESYHSIIEPQKYILSFLLAYCLFNTYTHSSNKGKKEIDNEINQVLTGKQILENVFEKYEITPEKGSNIIKRKIKTLK